jgi:cyclophilin family peptidyl-prolyl cis-trans isomerase
MACGESLDSASTSFFICLAPQPSLDGKYTVFGRVVSGMDVMEKMGSVPTFDSERPEERIDLLREVIMKEN